MYFRTHTSVHNKCLRTILCTVALWFKQTHHAHDTAHNFVRNCAYKIVRKMCLFKSQRRLRTKLYASIQHVYRYERSGPVFLTPTVLFQLNSGGYGSHTSPAHVPLISREPRANHTVPKNAK